MPSTYRPKARYWCFTLNNPSPGELDSLTASTQLQYLVYQREKGKKTGTVHFQGYIQLTTQLLLSTLKKLVPRAHWVIAKGTPVEARNYCMKEDTRIGELVELGEFSEVAQGNRSDIAEVQYDLDRGMLQHEYATKHFATFIRYPKLVENYATAKVRPRTGKEEIVVHFYYGIAGAGKSRLAFLTARLWGIEQGRIHGGQRGFYVFDLKQWFDGYKGERVIVIDDFRGSSCSFTTFKRLLDRYPFQMAVKGSSCHVAATHFIITSNTLPDAWWKEEVTGPELSAIYRRITHVKYFAENDICQSFDSYRAFAVHYDNPSRLNAKEVQEGEAGILQEEIIWEDLEAQVEQEELQEEIIQVSDPE